MVNLIKDFRYEKIPYQYALYRDRLVTDKETGEKKPVKTLVGYYNSLEAIITATARELADDKIAAGEITTIQEHIKAIRDTIHEITGGL